MRVRILYFAGVRDVVGVGEEARELPPEIATIADFGRWVARTHALEDRMATVRIAQNERFADPTDTLSDGDTLALIPPVSGG